MDCRIMQGDNIAGTCRCGKTLRPAHVVDEPIGLFCEDCCPVHRAAEALGPVETLTGTQEALF